MTEIVDYASLEKIFTPNKVRADLFAYFEASADTDIEIWTYADEGEKAFVLSPDDAVFIAAIKTQRKYDGTTYPPYIVDVYVGEFQTHATGIVDLEKFRVEIFYGDDFSVVLLDCYASWW